ncbi:MAG: GNAT family N-acetyltransferase [Candidatus Latescibacterota bacterium]
MIRPIAEDDAPVISAAFAAIGWDKPVGQFLQYAAQQREGVRECWIALLGGVFAGYVTLNWHPDYSGLAGSGIPEIEDLNVLPHYRRRHIATRLLDRAEEAARSRSRVVGIGVGLHPGYNAAQRLYVLRGYIPDARGATYRGRFVQQGEQVRFDDDLVLHFTRELRPDVAG